MASTLGTNERKAKLGQRGPTIEILGPPSIFRERLELETSNLACRFITKGTNERNAKLCQKGPEGAHVTYF